ENEQFESDDTQEDDNIDDSMDNKENSDFTFYIQNLKIYHDRSHP
ncbi:12941_t:CDS:1, partial [Dentiscutata heterogama]